MSDKRAQFITRAGVCSWWLFACASPQSPQVVPGDRSETMRTLRRVVSDRDERARVWSATWIAGRPASEHLPGQSGPTTCDPCRVARTTRANRALFAAGNAPEDPQRPWPSTLPDDAAALSRLGAEAFAMYPAAVDATWELRIDDDAALRSVGVSLDARGEAIGLVLIETTAGEWHTGYSCALCHARLDASGTLLSGPANSSLRFGDLLADAFPAHPNAARWRSWGPGRLDVTPDDVDDPLRIPDLVGLASVSYLQQSGAIRVVSPASLALRIESVLEDYAAGTSPDARVVSAAIVWWLLELRDPSLPDARSTGATAFATHCAHCHDGPALGGRTRIDTVSLGTDPRAASSPDRGTGSYRVAPLLGVGSRARFFHDGSLAHLADVLDPSRLDPRYVGGALAPGPVAGHPWGTELPVGDRDAIVRYLSTTHW